MTDSEGSADGGKVGAMNASVRSLCVVMMVATLCFAFLWGALHPEKPSVISSDAFTGLLAAAITWLFKSRDDKAMQPVTTTTDTDPTTGAKRTVVSTGTGTAPAPAPAPLPASSP